MCGIAGFVTASLISEPGSLLRSMTDAIAHRGPDDEGMLIAQWADRNGIVGLGHRRLSIIDLSTGHQPLGNEDGSVQIVFNGEIYNFQELRTELIARGHRFQTASDTETIVHAYEEYGDACVTRFRGMFAFALWDANRQRLLLARDPFGKKPLFLWESSGGIAFASEIKSLLAFPGCKPGVNEDAVWHYLSYRYVPGPQTLFNGIRKLNPGSYAVWDRDGLKETRYFIAPDRDPLVQSAISGDPIEAFTRVLDDSVRIRMISDVPFGAFLSGGLDSSSIVALMTKHSNLPIKTFSVGFKESKYSELGYAKVIADHFRTDHHELVVSHEHMIEQLPKLVAYRDAPVSEPADIPIFLLSQEARRTVKMVLTGEGSDEVLGGYSKHAFEPLSRWYQSIPALLRREIVERCVRALPYRFRSIKTAVATLGVENRDERMARWFGALSGDERSALSTLSARNVVNRNQAPYDVANENSPLRRTLYFDQTSWLPDNLLERGDRMTMAASLEGRMPFMDVELARFASSLPDHYRVRGRQGKWILKRAMERVLPAAILNRPKVGFSMPVNEWLRGPMKSFVMDQLMGADSKTMQYFRRNELQRLVQEHMDARQNHEKLMWSLLNLELWHRRYA